MPDPKKTILIVEDNPDTLEILDRKVRAKGFKSITSMDVTSAISVLETQVVDIVLTDYKMPKFSGLELIKHVHAHFPTVKVIMITGYPTIEGAVQAVKVGAQSYLTKPFTDEELFSAIDEAITAQSISLSNRKRASFEINTYGLIGKSPEMQKVYNSIRKSAMNLATVLIHGESGTGKELVARAIHYNSRHNKAPFVPINCGAIPETLLEAELFGYLKGSFTGATETRAGYFITADGGTIFLDEISETSLMMQVKLLRVLQDKQVTMIGSSKPRKINVRIIAATNKNLEICVKQGTFREDLYYRLKVLPISIPALRDHSGDIPELIYFFLNKYASETSQKAPVISDEAMNTLIGYPWYGNVRELENLMYQLVVMNESGSIEIADLPDQFKYSISCKANMDRTLAEVERDYIRDVLSLVKGNKTLAAKRLGIDRKTLYSKLDSLKDNMVD